MNYLTKWRKIEKLAEQYLPWVWPVAAFVGALMVLL